MCVPTWWATQHVGLVCGLQLSFGYDTSMTNHLVADSPVTVQQPTNGLCVLWGRGGVHRVGQFAVSTLDGECQGTC